MQVIRSLRKLIGQAEVTKAADDSLYDLRVQQVSYMGKVIDSEFVFPYGMSANVPAGARGLFFSVGGDDGNIKTLADHPQLRVRGLEPGEVAVYHPPTQSRVVFRNGGNIEIVSTKNIAVTVAGSASVSCPTTSWNGNIDVSGDTTVSGNHDVGGDLDVGGDTVLGGNVNTSLPTSPVGLATGDLWNNSGVVNVV